VNAGLICYRLDGWNVSEAGMIPDVGSCIGLSVLALGAMHFFNMFMIAKFGKTVSGWVSVREHGEHGEKVADSGVAPTGPLRDVT
jgi:hypothetical protein